MAGSNPSLQYYLVTDTSNTGLGGVLFQLQNVSVSTEATPTVRDNERIIMFMSFQLSDAETRYSNPEQECYVITCCLAEVRWLVIGSAYPVIIYTDHQASQDSFQSGTSENSRITK